MPARKFRLKKPGVNSSATLPEIHEAQQAASWVTWWMPMVITGLCAGLYAWTADFPFEYDDYCYMIENPWFKAGQPFGHWMDIRAFLRQPLESLADPDLAVNIVMRPVAYLTLQWNHLVSGFEPRGFRVVNMVIHALNGWLMFVLLRHVAGKVLTGAGSAYFVAAVAALAFTVHPLATESVTYIIQRFTSMGTTMLLACLLLHFASVDAAQARRRVLLRTGAVVCALTGMLIKENVATVPLLAVGVDRLLLRTRLLTAMWRALPLLLCLPVVPALVLLCSQSIVGDSWHLGEAFHLVNRQDTPWSQWQYLVSEVPVLVEYLRLMIWPSGQNLCWRPESYQSLLEGPVLGALAVLVVLTTCTVVWCWKSRQGHGRLALAGLVWFFSTISISSGIVPLPNLMAEHRTYLPSIGVFLLVGCFFDWLRGVRPGRWHQGMVSSAVMVILTCLAAATWARNEVWRSAIGLWKDTTNKSPHCYVAWVDLGAAEMRYGDPTKAVEAFRKAIEIRPRVLLAYYNLSDSLASLCRWEDCLEVVNAALGDAEALHPLEVQMLYYKGLSLAGMGKFQEGRRILEQVLKLQPDHFYAIKILGACHLGLREKEMARFYLQRAVDMAVEDPDLQDLLAQTRL